MKACTVVALMPQMESVSSALCFCFAEGTFAKRCMTTTCAPRREQLDKNALIYNALIYGAR